MSTKKFANPFITVQKDEGIHPVAKPLHFLFTLSQSLFQYNTMHLQSIYNALFYRGNTMGTNLGLTQYHGSAILLANTHPKTIFLGALPPIPHFHEGAAPEPSFLRDATLEPQGRGMSVQYSWVIITSE